MPNKLKILLFLTSLCVAIPAMAQVFPVQVTTQLSPPYSLYLNDYVAPGSERLALNVFLSNINRPEIEVKFKLKITGQTITIETKPEFLPQRVTLQGGIPVRLIGTDLAEYFNPENLNFQGITRRQFEQTGKLPEGAYQFCFEVYEYNRNVKISNTSCGAAWLILNDPPIVNLPRQNEKLRPLNPQNIVFQWTPRHSGSPNSAFTTEYEVKMVEVWPKERNVNDAILTSPVIFETTTRSTTFIYGPAETPLELGRRYAFRVQAKAITGVDELDLFKNNGYSEVFSFIYGDACVVPENIINRALSSSRLNVHWKGQPNHTAFSVRYREEGTSQWYLNNSLIDEADISWLKPGTKYEYQVSGTCGLFESDFTAIASGRTKDLEPDEFACGLPVGTFNLDPSLLTGSLKVGDIIHAGDFDVEVTTITGVNGAFSGEGAMVVPKMNKVHVRVMFDNITVTTDPATTIFRMVKGVMNVTGGKVDVVPAGVIKFMDKLDETLDVVDSLLGFAQGLVPEGPDPISFATEKLVRVEGSIVAVYRQPDGTVNVVDGRGNTTQLPPGTSYSLVDDSGKGYVIDKDGNFTKTTAANALAASKRKYNLLMSFAKNEQTKYGLDQKNVNALALNYEKIGDNYFVPWKAVEASRPEPVSATFEDPSVDRSRVRFEVASTKLAVPSPLNNRWELNLPAQVIDSEERLVSYYTPADTSEKEQILGKLRLISYGKKTFNLKIVPVNGVLYPFEQSRIITELNKIYSQAVVSWAVTMEPPVQTAIGATFDDGESGMLTNYTGDMKKVINAFGPLQNDTYYLFLVKNPKNGTLGFMPRSKQAGFIFVDKHTTEAAIIHTMAHELGHGAFTLKHIFSDYPALGKGTTKNLMDYETIGETGNELIKFQWDRIHDPVTVLNLFEGDEEGALAGGSDEQEVKRLVEEMRCGCLKNTFAKYLAPTGMEKKFYEVFNLKLLDGTLIEELHIGVRGREAPLVSEYLQFNPKESVVIRETSKPTEPEWEIVFEERGTSIINTDAGQVEFMSDKKSDLEKLLKYINVSQNDWNSQVEKRIIEFKKECQKEERDVEVLKDIIFSIRCGFEKLNSAELRYFILKLISDEVMFSVFDESVIIDILKTTPAGEESKQLFAKLKADDGNMLEEFNDIGGYGRNSEYIEYYKELMALYYRGTDENLNVSLRRLLLSHIQKLLNNDFSNAEDLAKNKILLWSDPNLFQFFSKTDLSYIDYENIKVNKTISFDIDHVNMAGDDYDFHVDNLDPFETVLVLYLTSSREFNNPQTGEPAILLRGSYLLMPAVGVFLLNNVENYNTFNRYFDAVTFMVPVGLGLKAARYGFIALETVLFTTQSVMEANSVEWSQSEGGRQVLRAWMVVNLVYSVIDMSGGIDDVKRAIQNLKLKVSKLPNSSGKVKMEENIRQMEQGLGNAGVKSDGKGIKSAEEIAKVTDEVIAISRKEFDSFGSEWIKENPFTKREMFNSNTGGYIVSHKKHNNIHPHEFSMGEAYARDGKKVKLLSEKGEPDVSTPDAEIVGEGIWDFKNISSTTLEKNISKNIEGYVLSAKNQANNIAFNLADNPNATPQLINQGVLNAIETAKASQQISLAEKVSVVYDYGTTKTIRITEFRKTNGDRF